MFKTPALLLLLPFLLGLLWLFNKRQEKPAITFSAVSLVIGLNKSWRLRLSFLPFLLQAIILTLLVIALAGPQRLLSETLVNDEGIDIVLALDVSGSMAAEDFTINGQRLNRLEVIKSVVKDFIKERKFDQLGLIAFGARAYTICPLTLDHDWLLTNLERVKLGIVEDGTAIGSGISSSLIRLKKSKAKSKVIILLTDGMNNAGKVDPSAAAAAAQAMGVKIYTIGAGTKGLAPFPMPDFFGKKMYQQVQIDIDEQMLTQIATDTGGRYFRATDTDSLKDIYKQIDSLEKSKIEQRGFKQYEPLYGMFLTAAFMLLVIYLVLINTYFLKVP